MHLVADERTAMTEQVQDHERSPTEGPAPEAEEHWQGFPGEERARSYAVPAGAGYGALFAVLVLAVMMVAMAFMTMNDW